MRFLLPFFFLCQCAFSQQFTEVPHFNDFAGLGAGPVEFADINSDGYPDIIASGKVAKVFLNDGEGKFIDTGGQPFLKTKHSSMAVGNITGDLLPDVLVSGMAKNEEAILKLYENQGNGKFIEVADVPFAAVIYGALAMADLNGNGRNEVIVSGRGKEGQLTKLYESDSTGFFTEVVDCPFPDLDHSAIKVHDINGDGHLDVLLSGDTGLVFTTKGDLKTLARVTKVYLNDSTGHFTEVKDTPFIGLKSGSIDVADVTGDSIPEILITGQSYIFPVVTKQYTYDGDSTFTEMQDSLQGIMDGEGVYIDLNKDGHKDILVAGKKDWKTGISRIYVNDGEGNFKERDTTSFPSLKYVDLAIADTNNDGSDEILVAGRWVTQLCRLFITDSLGMATETQELPFENVAYGDISLQDYDNDGDIDALISGLNGFHTLVSYLYVNDGAGEFHRAGSDFTGLINSSIASGDVNSDGEIDLLIMGSNKKGVPESNLYISNGDGNFSIDTMALFLGATKGDCAIADMNGDELPDIFYTGENSDRKPFTKLYLNNGDLVFEERMDTSMISLKLAAMEVADLNGDGYPDILITGQTEDFKKMAKAYFNDGKANFQEVINAPFLGVSMGDIAVADFNNDGFTDVIICGSSGFRKNSATVYLNDGKGEFTIQSETDLKGASRCSISIADIDGDFFPDVLISGSMGPNVPATKLYMNDGAGNFEVVPNVPFVGVSSGQVAVGDLNNDGLPDVLLSGYDGKKYVTRYYQHKYLK